MPGQPGVTRPDTAADSGGAPVAVRRSGRSRTHRRRTHEPARRNQAPLPTPPGRSVRAGQQARCTGRPEPGQPRPPGAGLPATARNCPRRPNSPARSRGPARAEMNASTSPTTVTRTARCSRCPESICRRRRCRRSLRNTAARPLDRSTQHDCRRRLVHAAPRFPERLVQQPRYQLGPPLTCFVAGNPIHGDAPAPHGSRSLGARVELCLQWTVVRRAACAIRQVRSEQHSCS